MLALQCELGAALVFLGAYVGFEGFEGSKSLSFGFRTGRLFLFRHPPSRLVDQGSVAGRVSVTVLIDGHKGGSD